jgi:hypothetical protein
MRRWICGLVIFGLCGGTCLGQEQPTPEQYKKMYTDALNQLKAAQDRKNELSAANEKLKKENAHLQQQMADLQKALAQLQDEKAHFLDRTFFLRSYHAAWRQFLKLNPGIGVQWEDFLGNSVPSIAPPQRGVFDLNWPLTAAR